jgi:hypothetical protein
VSSKLELERLMVDVVRTLRDAHMQETLRAFDERVLSRDRAHLFEAPADGSEQRFQPMVELLLQELVWLGAHTSMSVADRNTRALEAMHLAGF